MVASNNNLAITAQQTFQRDNALAYNRITGHLLCGKQRETDVAMHTFGNLSW